MRVRRCLGISSDRPANSAVLSPLGIFCPVTEKTRLNTLIQKRWPLDRTTRYETYCPPVRIPKNKGPKCLGIFSSTWLRRGTNAKTLCSLLPQGKYWVCPYAPWSTTLSTAPPQVFHPGLIPTPFSRKAYYLGHWTGCICLLSLPVNQCHVYTCSQIGYFWLCQPDPCLRTAGNVLFGIGGKSLMGASLVCFLKIASCPTPLWSTRCAIL